MVVLVVHRVRIKKDLQSSVNNFSKFERILTIFSTHYQDDMLYWKHMKFAFEIYL